MGTYRVEAAGQHFDVVSERDLTPDEILDAVEGRIYDKSPVIPKAAEKFLAVHPRIAEGTALVTRMVGPVVGGVGGTLAAGPFGTLPGAMAGGGVSSLAAQEIEKAAGLRQEESYGTLAADVALAGIPGARAARELGVGGKLLLSIQRGARYGLAQRSIEIAVDEGRLITPGEMLQAAGTGAAVGGAIHGVGMGVSAGRRGIAKAKARLKPVEAPTAAFEAPKAVAPGEIPPETPPVEAQPAEAAPAAQAVAEIPAPPERRTPAGFLVPEGVEPVQWVPHSRERNVALAAKVARSPAEQAEIARILKSIEPQLEYQRRGTVPDSETQRVAELLEIPMAGEVRGGRPGGEYQPGQAFNGDEIATLGVWAQAASDRWHDVLHAANAAPADAVLAAAKESGFRDYTRLLRILGGATTESGRALRQVGKLAELRTGRALARGVKGIRQIEAAEKKGLIKRGVNVQELANRVAAHMDDPIAAARMLREVMRTPNSERLRDWVYFCYLSRPATQVRNVLGNTEALVESQAGGALAAASGEPGVRLGEFGRPAVIGAATGFMRGARKAFEIIANGVTNEDLKDPDFLFRFLAGESATELATLRGINLPGDPLAKRAGRAVVKGVPRALQAMDVMFRTIAKEIATEQAAYRQAHATATRQGIKPGAAFKARRQELAAEALTDPNEAKLVELMGKRGVYQETPGNIAQWAADLDKKGVIGRAMRLLFLPFATTPANIIRRAVQKIPVVGLKSTMSEFQRQLEAEGIKPGSPAAERFRAQLIGEHALGYVAVIPIVWLAEKGLLASRVPEKTGAAARFYESGQKPGSLLVKVGDETRTVPLSAFGDAGVFANAVGAAVAELQRSDDAEGYLDQMAAAVGAASLSFRDASFLNGLREIFDTGMGDFDLKSVSKLLGRKAAGIAIPGVVQDIKRVIEPTLRKPLGEEGVGVGIQEAMSRAPGLSSQVQPRIGTFGEVRKEATGETVGQRIFSVLTGTSIVTTEPVRAELDRLEAALGPEAESVGPSPPGDEGRFKLRGGRKVELGPESLTAFKQALGQARGYAIEKEMRSGFYAQRSEEARARFIRRATRKAGDKVRNRTRTILAQRLPYIDRGVQFPPLSLQELLR